MGAEWSRILLPIQFSKRLPSSELQLARALARKHKATILLLHVVPTSTAIAADAGLAARYFVDEEAAAWSILRKMAQTRLRGYDTELYVEVGDPASTIVKQAVKLRADLVIIATHNRSGVKRFFLGSVAEHVVRRCPCALLTIRPAG